MTDFYIVYVGNLSVTLKNLFSQVGNIMSIKKNTYAFIKFSNLISAKEACKRFNNQKLDFLVIKVQLSKKKLN